MKNLIDMIKVLSVFGLGLGFVFYGFGIWSVTPMVISAIALVIGIITES